MDSIYAAQSESSKLSSYILRNARISGLFGDNQSCYLNCTSKYQLSIAAAQPQMGKKIDPSISRRVYCPNLIRTLRWKPYQIAKTYMNSQEFAHSNRFICGKPVVTWCKLWCKLSAKSRLYAVILTYTPSISPAASLSGPFLWFFHTRPIWC